MASRRGGSKRKQIGSSSAGGQAQEEGNLVDNALFMDDDAINRYNFLKNLAVLPCNCVKFSQFPQGDMLIEQIFRDIEWINYLKIKEPVYHEVVHQFYANLKPKKNTCRTMVSGISFQFSPREICATLEIPEGGDDQFEGVNISEVRATIAPNCTTGHINVGFLTPEHRALQWIISRILAQRKSSKSVVLSGDLLWFDYLLKRKRLNLGRFIYRNLIKTYPSNMGLPHGALITRLVKRNNVDLTPFMLGKVQSGTTLNKASFENIQYEFRNGSWRKKGDQAMEQQSDEEEGDGDQEMAEQGKKNMETEMNGFRTKMRGRMTNVEGKLTNVEGKLDRLVNHFFPPPPPDAT
ncbi:hypothetical protein SLEP1_g33001 [Rubroshorea leprosula]|uniref:Putative plant transposon protein domain-containing protein n=1 Tax=Rubroshorea leprosula TaxID=152421 RepID=A0AAV5KF95_9ROSI|nr:hypothetical protein SLEP1_g33001 [Rubroshorea leprosula]